MKSCDIAVVGAGPVGMTLALALAQSGYSVSLLEKHPYEQGSDDDVRRLALSWGSMQLLKSIGIDTQLDQSQPITSIAVRQAGSLVSTRFFSAEHRLDYFALAVGFSTLMDTLRQAVTQSNAIELYCPFVTEQLHQQQRTIDVCDKERSICANLAIAVDGSDSQMLGLLGISSQQYQYRQSASVVQVTLTSSLQSTACEVFAGEHTFVLIPRQDREATLIQIAPVHQDLCSKNQLNRAFLGLAPEMIDIQLAGSFPLVGTRADEILRPRCLVLGNAARTMHPLLAQGLNLSFAQISLLIQTLDGHNDPGSWALLHAYAQQAEALSNTTAAVVDGIRQLADTGAPMAPVFGLINLVQMVRDGIVDVASGHSAQRR